MANIRKQHVQYIEQKTDLLVRSSMGKGRIKTRFIVRRKTISRAKQITGVQLQSHNGSRWVTMGRDGSLLSFELRSCELFNNRL